jgi:hypothetical protein
VVIHGAVESAKQGQVWAAALLGFAALTVLPEFVETRRRTSRPRTGISTTVSSGRPTPRAVPRVRRRYVGQALVPTGWTATAHWVVGHIRVLPHGSEASATAESEAARVGIGLRSGQTWVRPHVRGGSTDRPLTFQWQAPKALTRKSRRS